MMLSATDPLGAPWRAGTAQEAALHALGANAVSFHEDGSVETDVDIDLTGFAAAFTAAQASRLTPQINAECTKRILAQITAEAQSNLTAYAAKLVKDAVVLSVVLTDAQKADLATIDSLFEWVNGVSGMLATARALIVAVDSDYAQGSKWPVWDPTSAGWTALVDRF